MTVGESLDLTATVTPPVATVTWTSSDTSIATVNNGKVTALKAGKVTITATANDNSGKKASCTVTVQAAPAKTVLVTSVRLDKTTASVNVGATLQLNPTVSPSNATDKSLTWTSSNTQIATVSASGLVTGVKAGSVTIMATARDGSGKKASCTVTVRPVKATSVTLDRTSATVYIGATLQLSATVLPVNTTDISLTWSSNKTSVATVSASGLVTGVKAGTATITATAKDGSGKKASCTVTVTPEPFTLALRRKSTTCLSQYWDWDEDYWSNDKKSYTCDEYYFCAVDGQGKIRAYLYDNTFIPNIDAYRCPDSATYIIYDAGNGYFMTGFSEQPFYGGGGVRYMLLHADVKQVSVIDTMWLGSSWDEDVASEFNGKFSKYGVRMNSSTLEITGAREIASYHFEIKSYGKASSWSDYSFSPSRVPSM